MADKSTQLVLDALSRAVADPDGLPLYGSKNAPGLFATTAPARQAAQRCKDEQYLRVVHTQTRGKTTQEICTLTDKGLAFLMAQTSPRQVLEDLVRALEARQTQFAALLEATEASRAALDAFRTFAETVLQSLGNKPHVGEMYTAWAKKGPHANGTPTETDAAPVLLSHLERWQESGASEDCPLPELYRRTLQSHSALTIGQFHDALRRSHEQGRVYLHPWTGPLYALPEPPFALLVGHEVAYYASKR